MQAACVAETAAIMGSIQHPSYTPKISPSQFPHKLSNNLNFINHFSNSKFNFVSNSLVTGRPPSSVSVPAPDIPGALFF